LTRKGSARDRDGCRVVGIILIEASHDLDIGGESWSNGSNGSNGASIATWIHDDPTLILHTVKRKGRPDMACHANLQAMGQLNAK